MSGQIDVLLFGLGAIGSFYAFILNKTGKVRLSVVARSNYDAVKENGISIDSEVYGKHNFKPFKVFKTLAEAKGSYDYVLCAHKAIGQSDVAEKLSPVVETNTTIVIAQNGVGNEAPFRKVFPDTKIITCVVWVGALQTAPGVIKHTKSEDTQLGIFPNPKLSSTDEKKSLDIFAALLREGGTPFTIEEDMQVKRWEKVVWNAAWNSLTTLTLMDTQSWLKSSPSATPITKQLMREVIDVARKSGVKIEYTLIDELLAKILAMPGIGSSMQADFKAGRAMEVEIILGTPVNMAKELGVATPIIDTIYALLTGINLRMK